MSTQHRFFKHRKQLEELGYISVQRPRLANGRLGQAVYVINEDPEHMEKPHAENQHVENPYVENQHVEKPHVENQHVDKPHVDKPNVENPHDYINNSLTSNSLTSNSQISNSLTNTPHTPQGGQDAQVEEAQPVKAEPERKPKKTRSKKGHAVNEKGWAVPDKDFRPEDFEQWWKAYPGTEDRDGAVGAWENAIRDGRLPELPVLTKALEWQVPLRNWRPRLKGDPNPNFTPYPTTYLNRNQWREEEPATYTPQTAQTVFPRFQQTGKLQGEALHEHNMEAARIALARINQAKAEGKAISPFALPSA